MSSVTLAVLGGKRSGKTSFIRYFSRNGFDENEPPTTQMAIVPLIYQYQGRDTKLSLLDIASNSITDHFKPTDELKNLLQQCLGAILIIDLTDPQALSTIPEYLTIIKENMKLSLGIIIVCSKSDLINQRKFSEKQLSDASEKYQIRYLEASFKERTINKKKMSQFLDIFSNRFLFQSAKIEFSDETKKYELDPKRFRIFSPNQETSKLGKGAFADVLKAEDLETRQIVAVKVISIDGLRFSYIDVLRREIALLCKVHNTFVVNTIGYTAHNPFTIVMEMVPNGNLFNHLHKKGSRPSLWLTNTRRTIIAMGIAYGMAYVHELNIIHRDLKSNNILIDSNYYPIICDFGIAKIDNNVNSTESLAGTLQWMAPEIMTKETYGKKVDVYSYAMILFELCSNQVPFYGVPQNDLIRNVTQKKSRPLMPTTTPKGMQDLIKSCWDQSPQNRPTFREIFMKIATHEAFFYQTDPKEIDKFLEYIKQCNPDDEFLKTINSTSPNLVSSLKSTNIDINSSNQSIKSIQSIDTDSGKKTNSVKTSESITKNDESKKKKKKDDKKKKKKDRSKSVPKPDKESKMHRSGSVEQERKGKQLRKDTSMDILSESDDDDLNQSSNMTSFDKLKYFDDEKKYEKKLSMMCEKLSKDSCFYFYHSINKIFHKYYKQWKQEKNPDESKEKDVITNNEVTNIHQILQILPSVLAKPHFFQRFIFCDCLTYLPSFSSEFIDDCMNVLIFCIQKNPNCINPEFAKLFGRTLSISPEKTINAFKTYISYFDSITNPWPFLDLIILNLSSLASGLIPNDENDNTNQMDLIGKYIGLLFQLCKYYPSYRKSRLFLCTKIIMKTLSFLYEKSAKDAYHFLTYFFSSSFYSNKRSPYIKINYTAISCHLKNLKIDQQASNAALQLIGKFDYIECGVDNLTNICKGLILHARTNPYASEILINKIASSRHGKMFLCANPAILLRPLPTYQITFSLFQKLYDPSDTKSSFKKFEEVLPDMFTDFLQAETKVAIPLLVNFFQTEKLNSSFVQSFEQTTFTVILLKFCKKAISQDIIPEDELSMIENSYTIIKQFADYEYLQSYLKYIKLIATLFPTTYKLKKSSLDLMLHLCQKYDLCVKHIKKHHMEFIENVISKRLPGDDSNISNLKRSIADLIAKNE